MVFGAYNTCSNKPQMKMLETLLWKTNIYYVQQEQCHKVSSHKKLQRLSYKHKNSYTNQYNQNQVELQLDFLYLVSSFSALLLAL
jgi:outer membrane receptor for ferrienterochelin and colicin